MSDIPADIMATAISVSDAVSFGGYEQNALSIARAILAERASHGWQPIKTAPAVGKKKMLFWTKNGRVVVGHRFVRTDIVISQDNVSYTATHWMPLPSAPEKFESGANAAANSPALFTEASPTRKTITTEGKSNV